MASNAVLEGSFDNTEAVIKYAKSQGRFTIYITKEMRLSVEFSTGVTLNFP
jgi:phosphosulfolactate phosphohydrolase-like enzyme